MPTAVAAARQSYADHPMVRLETAPPGPCHAVSLQETLSGTFTACATVILRRRRMRIGGRDRNGGSSDNLDHDAAVIAGTPIVDLIERRWRARCCESPARRIHDPSCSLAVAGDLPG